MAAVWMIASFGSAAVIAWIQRRAYPSLSFYKLWAFWTVVASFAVLAILLLGLL